LESESLKKEIECLSNDLAQYFVLMSGLIIFGQIKNSPWRKMDLAICPRKGKKLSSLKREFL
jgi:hypothetical protein